MNILFVNGCPSDEKTAYLKNLKKRNNLPIANIGALVPAALQNENDNIEWVLLVEDFIMDLANEFSSCNAGIIIDGVWNSQEKEELASYCEPRGIEYTWVDFGSIEDADNYYNELMGKDYNDDSAKFNAVTFENYLDGWPAPIKHE